MPEEMDSDPPTCPMSAPQEDHPEVREEGSPGQTKPTPPKVQPGNSFFTGSALLILHSLILAFTYLSVLPWV